MTHVKVSIPVPRVVRYWLLGILRFDSKNLKNAIRSPLNFVTCCWATKEKTVVLPFGPLNRFHLVPAIVVVATGVALPFEP